MHEQRFVVAVDGRSVVGAANCWQEQAPAGWQYYSLQYVDVRKDKRWSGIGTKILQNLDTQPFLQGKVLQLTRTASEEGAKFLEAVLRDGVLGNGYAVIPDDYKPTMPPGGVGVFDGEGGRV
ncbi:MAG: hypothetical protein OXR66_06915 [Candidatus Woesearchaeota archaeon]|nr:hypothetical protein [Candidatus Woesearchaeota archaeon]